MTDFAPLTLETPAEHPFAQFVRILGKGKRGARNLTREEAREAMGMLLDEKVEDTQLGAFLMLLRHKEESPEELAGFTDESHFCRVFRKTYGTTPDSYRKNGENKNRDAPFA